MAHLSAIETFPPTNSGYNAIIGKVQSTSPHVVLLPYLEQSSLFVKFNPAEKGLEGPNEPPSSTLNSSLVGFTVPVFVCPSDRPSTGGNSYRANMGIGPALHGGGVGAGGWDPSNGSGAFVSWHPMRASEFRDGLSNTALFSEKLIGDNDSVVYTPSRDYFFSLPVYTVEEAEAACGALPLGSPPPHESFGGDTWLFGSYRQTWYNHIRGPNSPSLDCATSSGGFYGAHTARSFHEGGVNLLLADGSARLVSGGIALHIWRALATRAHGDALLLSDP